MAKRSKAMGPYLSEQANRELRSARVRAGLTQKKVALALGIGETSYVLRENGRQAFTIPEANKLKEVLGLSYGDILKIFFDADMSGMRAAEKRSYFAWHEDQRERMFMK